MPAAQHSHRAGRGVAGGGQLQQRLSTDADLGAGAGAGARDGDLALGEMGAVQLARAVLQRYPLLEVLGPREGYRLRSSWLTYALAELRVSAF
ncbi:hypothetical protein [Nocardia tengchongensis]|uniref:hypothetical protein n=1 Tax=Nocardia tengchongensis TaxID=2055889 RepID=UPI0036216457